MTKNELINYASIPKYKSICKNLIKDSELAKDLFQEFLLILLEYDEKKIKDIKELDAFLYKILRNMAHSSTSPFYQKFRKRVSREDVAEYTFVSSKDISINIEKQVEKIYWYDREILKKYAEYGSSYKVSKYFNIPVTEIKRTIQRAKKEIKAAMIKPKILLLIQHRISAIEHYRLLQPHSRMIETNKDDIEVVMIKGNKDKDGNTFEPNIDNLTDEELKRFNLVYIQRQVSFDSERIERTINRLKNLGLKIVFDIDDSWILPAEHGLNEQYKEKKIAANITYTLPRVDWVSTTTEELSKKIQEFNENVSVFPNCISPSDQQFTIRYIPSSRVRFGWLGGLWHKQDVTLMGEGLKRLWHDKNLYDKWQVVLAGYNPNPEHEAIEKIMTENYTFRFNDKSYYDYLSQNTPLMEHFGYDKNYRRVWARGITDYGDGYNNVDVCLVPLQKNNFNNCKSELKIVEAGTMKKAVICSDTLPYNKWIKNGVNGLLVKSDIDWYVAMRKLINSPNQIQDMGESLHETIKKNFSMDEWNQKRLTFYRTIL